MMEHTSRSEREKKFIPSTNSSIFVLSFVAIVSLASVVIIVVTADALLPFIGALIVIGLVLIGLFWVAVHLFRIWADAIYKLRNLNYNHAEQMVKQGYLFERGEYRQLPPPQAESDIPVSISGFTNSAVEPYRIDALELLALSKLEMGEASEQVIPFYRARSNPYFKDVAVWTNAVRWLIINQVVIERYDGRRKLGTFLRSGTVGQVYQQLK